MGAVSDPRDLRACGGGHSLLLFHLFPSVLDVNENAAHLRQIPWWIWQGRRSESRPVQAVFPLWKLLLVCPSLAAVPLHVLRKREEDEWGEGKEKGKSKGIIFFFPECIYSRKQALGKMSRRWESFKLRKWWSRKKSSGCWVQTPGAPVAPCDGCAGCAVFRGLNFSSGQLPTASSVRP